MFKMYEILSRDQLNKLKILSALNDFDKKHAQESRKQTQETGPKERTQQKTHGSLRLRHNAKAGINA
ncbi:MAG: hypothetical protein H7831_15790 [Magnetococcus sp. WYHC-3]